MGLDNPIHIAFLLILLLLVFGAKRLPELGRSLGSGMRGFKESLSGESAEPPPAPRQLESAPLATSASGPTPAPAPADEPEAPVAA
jgi:sec-independent protein translocase protein TatA